MIGYRRPLFGTVGIVAVLLGLGLILVPDIAAGGPVTTLVGIVETVGPTAVLLVTGGTLVGYLVVGLRSPRQSGDVDAFDLPGSDAAASAVAGGAHDEVVDTAIADGGESFQHVTATLRETATAVYADRTNCSRREARTALDGGEWCTDPLAAAVLSEQQSVPFGAQVRLFVVPDRERRRRIERVLAAIERLEEP